MQQYLNLLDKVRTYGVRHENRTGIDTIRVFGETLKFDLTEGFPLVTTRKLSLEGIIGEQIAFLRGYTNAADFRALGCNLWNANANVNKQWLANPHRKGEDDLGKIYGYQWRNFFGVDQIANMIDIINNDPDNRRNIVTAWNPAELDQMALPPCHYSFTVMCDKHTKELSLDFTMRSCDLILGTPSNIAGYAIILELLAKATGYTAKHLCMRLIDAHIYSNHLESLEKQLIRNPLPLAKLKINNPNNLTGLEFIENVVPGDIEIHDYNYHPFIKFDMAV